MKSGIARYELVRHTWAMRSLVRNANAQWTERTSVLIALHADGLVGYGEASPLPGYSSSSLEQCERDLDAGAATLVGRDVAASASWEAAFESLNSQPLDPCARFALETAVLDLRGKRRGEPLWAVLRSNEAHPPAPVRLSAILLADDEASGVASARAAYARGIRCGKLKVGCRDVGAEQAIARAIRREMGDVFGLRLDANGAWSAAEVRARLDAFADIAPEYLEEPAEPSVWMGLESSPIPLAIDETLARPGGIEAMKTLAARGTCQVVTLKLAIVGGFARAFDIARQADAAGIDAVVTHMFEGPVASAAAAAFALALPLHRRCAGLDVQPYATWPEARSAWCTSEGVIAPWSEPGIGAASPQ